MKTFGQHSKELEESPLNTQSIQGLKIMADRMVRKLSGEGLQKKSSDDDSNRKDTWD